MQTPYTFPFGQPVETLTQRDRSPKKVFVVGVYASAVHARWVGVDGKTVVTALAVSSEPYIFWTGDKAEAQKRIAKSSIPHEVGTLEPAAPNMNGPSGKALDALYLNPLGFRREDAWLCDIVPYSCRNAGQDKAIREKYVPLMEKYGLSKATTPPVPKNPLCDDDRPEQILAELRESGARKVVLLGDQPIKWFLGHFEDPEKRHERLADFGDTHETYGRVHNINIGGQDYDVLPLVHPRQASKLGAHSAKWYGLHQEWMKNTGPLRTESRNGDTRKTN